MFGWASSTKSGSGFMKKQQSVIIPIDITKGNLSRWENGVNVPSLRFAGCLAQYFSVSLDYLIGLTNVRTPVDLLAVNRRPDDSDLDADASEENATKDDG